MHTVTTVLDGSRGALPRSEWLTMACPMPNVLLVGPSGSGKTGLVREVLAYVGLKVSGYYSAENRVAGRRAEQGEAVDVLLEVTRVSGGTMTLAGSRPRPGWQRVGEQHANPEAVDSLCRLLWEAACSTRVELVLLDEIGPPLAAFESFRRALVACFDSGKRVLATLNVRELLDGDERLLELLRRRPDLKTVEMDPDRELVLDRLVSLLAKRPRRIGRRKSAAPRLPAAEDRRP